MTRLVSAELLKLRSVRSLSLTLVAGLALVVFLSRQMLGSAGTGDAPALGSEAQLHLLLSVPAMLGVVLLLFGALAATADLRYRTVIGDYLAVPRRWPVLAAKIGAVLVAALAWAVLAGALQLAVTLPALSGAGIAFSDAMTPELWRHAAASLLVGPLLAVVGVGLGTVVRNQAFAAGGSVLWFAFLEHELAAAVPGLGSWLPATASLAMGGMSRFGDLGAGAGALLLAAWALGLGAVAAAAAVRRDV